MGSLRNARRFADGLDRGFRRQEFVHGNGVQVDVEHLAADGVMLDFLDQRRAGQRARRVLDGNFHQHALARGVGEQPVHLALDELEIARRVFRPVDDRRHEARALDLFDRGAAGLVPGLRVDLQLDSHKKKGRDGRWRKNGGLQP